MRKAILLLLSLICITLTARDRKDTPLPTDTIAQTYRYRLTLKDKAGTPFSVKHPEKFLSPKSIERRKRFGLAVDKYDLPITPAYLERISATGAEIFNMSKWNNTVQVSLSDTTGGTLAALRQLPFVSDVQLVYDGPAQVDLSSAATRKSHVTNRLRHTFPADSIYGSAQRQVDMLNLPALHELGYRGEGMTIAVIDGGFYNADVIAALSKARILGTRNFTRPDGSVYDEHYHGMMVLSCIAANEPRSIVGTAPEAAFYLLESEDTYYEYRGEEDNWCAALEYADSLGVDVVTSSLGYTSFDTPEVKLQYHWLDGRHELNSRSASLAASRGILLCNSAGNEGSRTWKKIGFPADASDILTVGAVNDDGTHTAFSSIGYSADGRVKPDCMAMGGDCALLSSNGSVTTNDGTSFACPILAGAVTCLLQACPSANPLDVIDAVHRASSSYDHPNEIYGYGIPDIHKAYELLSQKKK